MARSFIIFDPSSQYPEYAVASLKATLSAAARMCDKGGLSKVSY
jgi:hypothetical protein